MKTLLPFAAFLSFCTSSAAASGKVWVVNDVPGPGVDFISVQPAVDAAASGDTILVRDGFYTYANSQVFTIDGKSLDVIADNAGGTVSLRATVTIKNLGALQHVGMRGFWALGFGGLQLTLAENAGAVWIEDCAVEGVCSNAADITNCAQVVFIGCGVYGTACTGGGTAGGIFAHNSQVSFYDGFVYGGTLYPSGNGADAVVLDGGLLMVSGSTIRGGAGACPYFFKTCFGTGAPTGDGLLLQGNNPQAWLLDCVVQAGPPGGASCPINSCVSSALGLATNVLAGGVNQFQGSSKTLKIGSPVRELQTTTLTLSGAPGDIAVGLLAEASTQIFLPPFSGTLLPALPGIVLVLGSVPPSGSFSLSFPLADLGGTTQSVQIFAQAAFCSGGACVLSAGSELTVLDQAF